MPDRLSRPHQPAALPGAASLLVSQIRYQVKLLLGSGRALAIGVGLPVILLITSSNGHGRLSAVSVAGLASFGLTLTAWNTYGVRLVLAREAGILKRWRASPLPRPCYLLGRITATAIVSVLAAAAAVAVAVLLFHTHLTVGDGLALLIVFTLGAAAWAAAATALTGVVSTAEAASPIFTLVYFPVIIISGALGTIHEPAWLHTLATYLPAQPMIHAATLALHRSPGASLLPARELAVLVAWLVAGLALAVPTFRWEPHRPTGRRPARVASHTLSGR